MSMPSILKASSPNERAHASSTIHAEQSYADSDYRRPDIKLELLIMYCSGSKIFIITLYCKMK
jgi:hypothetical protein